MTHSIKGLRLIEGSDTTVLTVTGTSTEDVVSKISEFLFKMGTFIPPESGKDNQVIWDGSKLVTINRGEEYVFKYNGFGSGY